MIRQTLSAAALFIALPLAPQAAAQSVSQEEIEDRYDRALAAGYKALFLCSAIGNADPSGLRRAPRSVEAMELFGIQAPLDDIVGTLEAKVETGQDRALDYVSVIFADEVEPRVAVFKGSGQGCSLLPIGANVPAGETPFRQLIDTVISPGTQRPQDPQTNTAAAKIARTGFDPAYGEGTRTTAVLIQRDGRILGEAFAPGYDSGLPQRTWSVAKSIASTIIGAAVQRGAADTEASAGLGASDIDPRRAITIDHLLRMASGRYQDTPGNRTDALYFGGSTVRETALHWPLVFAPGTVFRYANNDTLAAVMAIDETFDAYPPTDLFAKLGMDATVAETDWQGDYILSSQVWSTARDLAKLGQLYLDDGVLPSGERILPEGWAEYVATPSGPQPDGPFGYGAGFWLFDKSKGVPADTYAMMGNRGQYVVIVPRRDIVIVRRGEDPVGARFDIAAFTRDVLAATP
ncbi:class C beta-lactamase-related serine hydrolase [Erythrobacter litoralis]|uniref:serine hydrolase domain-containing protein n=1 Tax=Erythrobacter litoralis TaxID=39960 RepID=UPI00243494AD|nr:serine hydrolase [Erythrobacter litoralis]MDG6078454.1 class C beta-lactamase-related serine hydrolase [Erythrobacter litoralis]